MQDLFTEVEKELPLHMEYETDCRDTWPKRWALLKAKVKRLTPPDNAKGKICPDCDGGVLAEGSMIERPCHKCHGTGRL